MDRSLATRQNPSGSGQPSAGLEQADTRLLRHRIAAHSRALDNRAASARPFGSARFLGQVYDGGAMPAAAGLFYLTHLVQVTGAVAEGGAGTFTADTATTVPVLVLRGVPSVGDYLTAYSVGGRWVSELGASGGGGRISCSPCTIPASDLTISWTNSLNGNGSDTLVYSLAPSPIWQTGCSGDGDAVIFRLGCASGSIELRVYFFTTGLCPSGDSTYCSNLESSPHSLTLSLYDCSPFSLTFTCGAACSFLQAAGYMSFTITP